VRTWNWLRIATTTVLTTLAATGLVIWQVIDPWHAAATAALATALSILWSATAPTTGTTTSDPAWPRTPVEARAGGRHDVSDLGWSVFGRDGHVTDRVVRRIRTLAADRLRAHGVDPADPAAQPDAERLLGARVLRQLTSRQPPTARTVKTWLDAIERLGAAPTTAPTTQEHRA
jgi:DNA/RNA-binding domain of Phe-tRNA-synthetase-like protein